MSKGINSHNIMRLALGEQWQALPVALQAHYQDEDNRDIGELTIEYPAWMQLFLNLLHIMGALLNRNVRHVPTVVHKTMDGERQIWQRTITLDENKNVYFKSHWVYAGQNKLVEYVNPMLGLCMSVNVVGECLHYTGEYYVLRLGKLCIPIPEWLMLGHTTIVEQQSADSRFKMDFKLQHPLFGQVYRYSGEFTTVRI
ncbi:MAG: DUF4166 domain-containing protein [Gammaproteobacteria bacterium]|nr:DUF4166 domain-containing protein [Gammaproteobacteria bacterium]MDH5800419.1 DUF4166 domain-containing protein [Gammaproteobacteria bacterium]